MIKCSHLTKIYGDRIAVNDLSFEIEKGSICGFLGPNGAGKSTTMNMITGYLAQSSGTIVINDVNMQASPVKAKKMIGYLPEIPPVYPDMKVKEYLAFVAELKGISRKDIKNEVSRVEEKTGITLVSDRLIKNLSKGYKQRVGLAQALIGDPEFLILDEPTVGLDPKQIVEIRQLIQSLGQDHTVILSTHILSEVSAICNRLLVISHGHIVADDTPENLLKQFNESQQYRLVIKGNSSTAEKMLGSTQYVKDYTIVSESANTVTVKVVSKDNMDIREILSIKCNEFDIILLELTVLNDSLEDIYLKLTSEQHYKEILQIEGPEDNEGLDDEEDEE